MSTYNLRSTRRVDENPPSSGDNPRTPLDNARLGSVSSESRVGQTRRPGPAEGAGRFRYNGGSGGMRAVGGGIVSDGCSDQEAADGGPRGKSRRSAPKGMNKDAEEVADVELVASEGDGDGHNGVVFGSPSGEVQWSAPRAEASVEEPDDLVDVEKVWEGVEETPPVADTSARSGNDELR